MRSRPSRAVPFAAGANPSVITFNSSTGGEFAYVTNAGSNNVSAYTINLTTGALTAIAGSPFAGRCQSSWSVITFNLTSSGNFAYVANQNSNNVSAYSVDATTGALTAIAGSPFAAGANPSVVNIRSSATGFFAYVANQNSNNVSAYSVDATTGALLYGHRWRSPFAVTAPIPSGIAVRTPCPHWEIAYVVNTGSNNVSAYAVNTTTGALTAMAGSPFATGTGPDSLSFDASADFAYLANHGSGSVSAFSINSTTGALTAVAGSPFATGANPYSVTLPIDNFDPWAY